MADIIRQMQAGLATIPSAAMQTAAVLINPLRTYRQVTGQATEADKSRYGEGLDPRTRLPQVLEGAAAGWNDVVARTLGVKAEPSLLDDTGEAVAKIAGQSIPALPSAAVRGAMTQAPRVARWLGNVAEVITPTTVVTKQTAGHIIPRVAANVGVQSVLGGAIEKVAEPFDPTVPRVQYDENGDVVSRYTPAEDQTPGPGRVMANAITETAKANPVGAATTGAVLTGLAVLGGRGIRNAAKQRAEMATSDIVKPRNQVDENVPIIETRDPATGDVTWGGAAKAGGHRLAEVLQDANIRTKEAVRQASPNNYDEVRDAIDSVAEATHKDRLTSFLETGMMETPRGVKQTESIRRMEEDLYHAGLARPDLRKAASELIAIENEMDNRWYAMQRGHEKVLIDKTTGKRADQSTPAANLELVTPRVTLSHLSDQDLARRAVDLRRNDPEASKFADRYHKFHSDTADALMDFGLLGKKERDLWGRANPNFMHTVLDLPKSPRTRRIREHDTLETQADPFLAAAEYADFMLGHAYRNRMRQQVVDALKGAPKGWIGNIADPAVLRRTFMLDPITRVTRPMTKKDVEIKGDKIHFYRDGEKVDVEIRNKQVLHTLETMPRHAQTIMGWARGLAQSGMTGKIAMLVGQPFALANAVMGGMFASVVRPAGRSFGYLDKGTQWLTGGMMGFRGDPTAIAGMMVAGTKDVASILTRAVGEALHNSIAHNGWLAKIPGSRAIADGAARKYVESVYAERHRGGSGGASTMGERDFDTAGNRATVIGTVAPHGDKARVVGGPMEALDALRDFRRRVTPANVQIGVRMLNDINEAIGNVAQSHFYRINRGARETLNDAAKLPENLYAAEMQNVNRFRNLANADRQAAKLEAQKRNPNTALIQQLKARARQHDIMVSHHEQLAAPHRVAAEQARRAWFKEVQNLNTAARQLLGDPSQMGTALRDFGTGKQGIIEKSAGFWINATPYANIGLQAQARLIRAMKENPVGTSTALAMTLGPLVLTPIASAILYDRKRVEEGLPPEALANEMSLPAWAQTRLMRVYIPGVPVEETLALRLDPLLAFPYTLARELTFRTFDLLGDEQADPTIAFTKDQILDLANARSMENIRTSAMGATPISQLPPVIGAGLAALGAENPTLENVMSRGGITMLPERGMGGFEDTRLANDTTSKRVDAVLGQLFGGAATTAVTAIRGGYQAEQNKPGDFFPAAADVVQGKAKDRLPELAPLWKQQQRRATNDFTADAVNAKEAMVTRIQKNAGAWQAPGTVGSGRFRDRSDAGGGRQGVADEDMRRLLAITARFGESLKPLREYRVKLRGDMLDVEQRGLPFAQERAELNRISKEITRTNAMILARYTRFEDSLQPRFGGRRIRVDKIDPTKPISQFEAESRTR